MSKRESPFPLFLITLLCASNAFLVETNITQTIAAALGGTILQYQISVGLFIFSLGMGSLLYLKVSQLCSHRSILLFSTLGLAMLAIIGPALVYGVGETFNLTLSNPLAWLAYLPLVLVGLITGLDLPTLVYLGQERLQTSEKKILGWDYLGMFVACLAFPLLFQKFGILSISLISVLVGLMTWPLVSQLPSVPNAPIQKWRSPQRRYLLILSFLLAFCSLSYELLLARWMVDFFSSEVFAVTYAIGFYLMGLAIGSFAVPPSAGGRHLLRVETLLILSVLCLPLLGYALATLWTIHLKTLFWQRSLQGLFLIFVGWVGFWSGHELPILMQRLSKEEPKAWPVLFFWNYIGALAASLVVSLALLPHLGLQASILLIAGLNLVAFALFLALFDVSKQKILLRIALITLGVVFVPQLTQTWEQIYLKAHYNSVRSIGLKFETLNSLFTMDRELMDIRRITTPYQYIDLVRTEIPGAGTGFDDLHMYLNHEPQFSLFYHALYHDSFSWGAVNLNGRPPKNVLVLGGGDGLLAHRLRQVPGIENIILVELDAQMIELAKTHWRISKANGQVFASQDIQVIIQDAFSWLKTNQQRFDGIFIDFPYPNNYEVSRLYSVEFYQRVFASLSDDGFLIMNAPISFEFEKPRDVWKEGTQTLMATLDRAGFKNRLPFGAKEPFIFAKKRGEPPQFDYNQLPGDFPNSSFVNLVPIKEAAELNPSHRVNSVYRPQKVVTW